LPIPELTRSFRLSRERNHRARGGSGLDEDFTQVRPAVQGGTFTAATPEPRSNLMVAAAATAPRQTGAGGTSSPDEDQRGLTALFWLNLTRHRRRCTGGDGRAAWATWVPRGTPTEVLPAAVHFAQQAEALTVGDPLGGAGRPPHGGGAGGWGLRHRRHRLVAGPRPRRPPGGVRPVPGRRRPGHRRASRFGLSAKRAAFRVAELENTGLPDASAHGIVCVDALGGAADRDTALRELGRVLAPGGRLVMTRAARRGTSWCCRSPRRVCGPTSPRGRRTSEATP